MLSKVVRYDMANYEKNIQQQVEKFYTNNILDRLQQLDHTIWGTDPEEISNRLGWLNSIDEMSPHIASINSFTSEIIKSGFKNALVLGMGGSSLAPEVFAKTFGMSPDHLILHVLDTTDPESILQYTRELEPEETLYIVSTKSGGTVETLSFLKYFFTHMVKTKGEANAGKHFVAITDPDSGLEKLAKKLNFRKIFLNNPDIGGRYSALTYFGLVPAALAGVNLSTLLDRSRKMYKACLSSNIEENPGVSLGITLGELALAGRDKATFILSKEIQSFGAWVEQLIAESTGKEGKGILPVTDEQVLPLDNYSEDRVFIILRLKDDHSFQPFIGDLAHAKIPLVELTLDDIYDLGGEYFRWEFATAIAGWCLQINPFDQPNVESAKVLAKEMVDSYMKTGKLPEIQPVLQEKDIKIFGDVTGKTISEILHNFLLSASPGKKPIADRNYISIQAYLKPDPQVDQALQSLRTVLQKKYRSATTVAYGPRFLHSTGQLHKGDAGNGLFLQITSLNRKDVPIPDQAGDEKSSITFGILKKSQYLGDQRALQKNGRAVLQIDMGSKIIPNIHLITKVISG